MLLKLLFFLYYINTNFPCGPFFTFWASVINVPRFTLLSGSNSSITLWKTWSLNQTTYMGVDLYKHSLIGSMLGRPKWNELHSLRRSAYGAHTQLNIIMCYIWICCSKVINSHSQSYTSISIYFWVLSPFLIGRMFVREPSWKYSANLVGS